MNRPPDRQWLLPLGAVAYPFLVYLFIGRVPPWIFLALGLALGAIRLFGSPRRGALAVLVLGFAGVTALLGALYCVDAQGAVQAYPVVVSLSFAAVFGFSLVHPPSVAERIARLTRPDLPPAGIRYTRRVTWIWFAFLIVNAAISFATIRWGTLAQWTLWNGLLSYLAMGALFAGEYLVRRAVLP